MQGAADKIIKAVSALSMDDYFLCPEQRAAERISEPGGNVDYERFYSEILLPLRNGVECVIYQPYDCRTQSLKLPVKAHACAVNIVEGSYGCHPALWDAYDWRIFLNISSHEQMKRILERNGESQAAVFRGRWIPRIQKTFPIQLHVASLRYETSHN